MHVVLAILHSHLIQDRDAVLITVSQTWQSAPRPVGAMMVISDEGAVSGAVSGGCVESAIIEAAAQVRSSGLPAEATYGVSDDEALDAGLPCGGSIRVIIELVNRTTWPELIELASLIDDGQSVVLASHMTASQVEHLIVSTNDVLGGFADSELSARATADARDVLDSGRGFNRTYVTGDARHPDTSKVVLRSLAKPRDFLIFGAIDYAQSLASLAKAVGYRVVVCDARPVFATRERFPDVDEVARAWPHLWLAEHDVDEHTVICVLTHDPKFDIPVLEIALRSNAAYVGAMGSRRTHRDRVERLRTAGLSSDQLAQLHSPIGLDLNASSPADTAVAILAEIVMSRNRGTARPLRDLAGTIHVPAAHD